MHRCKERPTESDIKATRLNLAKIAQGQDTRGMEIAHAIRRLGVLIDLTIARSPNAGELSGPRLGILMRLQLEDERGNHDGLNPTRISHYQGVQKNTMTDLLKALEEDGLIERVPDPQDRRAMLIRITRAGRDLVYSSAPSRFNFLNQLVCALSVDEQDQLLTLLERLRNSLTSTLVTEQKESKS